MANVQKYEEIANDLISGNVQHCIVEASAGTGKTYTIENLVVELIKSPKDFIDLSQLMLVTFTEKAAGELRERILSALKKTVQDTSLDAGQRKKIQKSVDAIDSAQISTFHGFCQKTMSNYAYDANLPFSFDLVGKNGLKSLVDKACRDEWVNGEFSDFVKYGADGDRLSSLVKNLLEKYNEDTTEWPAYNGDEFYQNCLSQFTEKEVYEIAFAPRTESSAYKSTIEQLECLIQRLEPYAAEEYKCGPRSSWTVQELIKDLVGWKEKVKKLQKVNEQWYASFDEVHPDFNGLESQIASIQSRFVAIPAKTNLPKLKTSVERLFVLKVAKKIYKDWQRSKQENKQKTFDDLISNVFQEVSKEGSLLKSTLQKKYKMVIIDEFQDTNAVQWGIFEKLFLNERNHILVVGDPKQSIYAFQGADIEIYKKAKEQIKEFEVAGKIKGKLYTLEANYRSSEKMIKACNALFCGSDMARDDGEELCLFFDKNQTFSPATAGNPKGNVATFGDDFKPFWISTAEDERGYADFCVERLAELFKVDENGKTAMQVKGRNLKFSDVAVLTRKSREFDIIEEKFSAAGIPFLRYKDATLFSGEECAHWEWLLRAIASPNESREFQGTLRAAMLTDFFRPFFDKQTDKRLEQVAQYSFEATSECGKNSLLAMFGEWRRYAVKKRWTTLIEAIYKDTGVEIFLSSPENMGRLARLKQIGDYVQDCLLSGNYSLTSLAQHLRQLNTKKSEGDSVEDDSGIVAKGSDIDAVQLMTMHASKGLEFPVVIIFGGFTGAYTSVSVSLGTIVGDKRQIGFGYNSGDIDAAESRRIFYVAFTRAGYLVMTWNTDSCSKGAPLSEFVKSALDQDSFKDEYAKMDFEPVPNANAIIKESVQKLSEPSQGVVEDDSIDEKLENLNLPSKTMQQKAYSSITRHKHITSDELKGAMSSAQRETVVQDGDSPTSSDDEVGCGQDTEFLTLKTDLPRGSHFGNALHKIFECTDFSKVDKGYLSSAELQNLMENSFGEEHLKFDAEKHGSALKNVLYNVLHEVIADRNGDQFTLAGLQQDQTKREMLFQFSDPVAPNAIIKGFIDLLFIRGEGENHRYYILDWKSDGLEVYNTDRMILQVNACEYSVQKVLYSYYLIKWLKTFPGFPRSEEKIFEKHFGGIYYVFARGAENGETCILSHKFEQPENVEDAAAKFDFWDYASLKNAFEKIMIERVNIGGSNEK